MINAEQTENTKAEKKSLKEETFDWMMEIVSAVVILLLVFTFAIRTVDVVGNSMVPTLHNGEKLVLNRFLYTPKYGDIVVLTKPCNGDEPLIKRIIATENQEVDIDFAKGIVYVDGVALEENYIADPTNRSFDMTFPCTVPEGCVFVMGDNRNHSKDSRDSSVGMVDERYIMGKVVFRITPFEKMGRIVFEG